MLKYPKALSPHLSIPKIDETLAVDFFELSTRQVMCLKETRSYMVREIEKIVVGLEVAQENPFHPFRLALLKMRLNPEYKDITLPYVFSPDSTDTEWKLFWSYAGRARDYFVKARKNRERVKK